MISSQMYNNYYPGSRGSCWFFQQQTQYHSRFLSSAINQMTMSLSWSWSWYPYVQLLLEQNYNPQHYDSIHIAVALVAVEAVDACNEDDVHAGHSGDDGNCLMMVTNDDTFYCNLLPSLVIVKLLLALRCSLCAGKW